MKSQFALLCAFMCTFTLAYPQCLSGTYQIGGPGNDYPNFNAAITDLENVGVCGHVIFEVSDSTYDERCDLNNIPGSSDTSTVTFRSMSGDSSTVILTNTGIASQNYTWRFDDVEYVTLHQLTIMAADTQYARVVAFRDSAHHNTVSNCRIVGVPNATTISNSKAVIYSLAGYTVDNFNVIENNLVEGGSFGAQWYGEADSLPEIGTRFHNNHFKDYLYRGILVRYHKDIQITDNIFESSVAYNNQWRLYVLDSDSGLVISGNRILGNQYGRGITVSLCSSSVALPALVANNVVSIGDSTNGTISYGIVVVSSTNLDVVHNSINMYSTGANSRALHLGGGTNYRSLNNTMVSIKGYAGVYGTPTAITLSDHNNYYSPNGITAYWGANAQTLADLQAANGMDMNSISADPLYDGLEDLHSCADTLSNKGTPFAAVTEDINGLTRDMVVPDIGAFEISPVNIDIGPDTVFCSGSTLDLTVPGTQGGFLWSNNAMTQTITVGTGGTYYVDVTTECGTGTDTVEVVEDPGPTAGFTYTGNGLQVNFMNTSPNTTMYSWNFGDGNTDLTANPVHVYATAGTYNVCVFFVNDCGFDNYCDSVYVPIVGVDDPNSVPALNVLPNPNAGSFMLELPGGLESGELRVWDIRGSLLLTRLLEAGGKRRVEVETGLPPGLYIVELRRKDGVLRRARMRVD